MSIPGRVSSLAYLLTLHPRAQHRRDRCPTRSCSRSQQGPQPASASWSYPRPPCAFSGKPSEKGELPEPACGALAPGDFAHSCVLWSGPENTTMLRPSLRLRLREARNFSCDPSRPGGILGTKLELGRAGTLAAAGPCTPEMKVREDPFLLRARRYVVCSATRTVHGAHRRSSIRMRSQHGEGHPLGRGAQST